jgi:hypothetical protein
MMTARLFTSGLDLLDAEAVAFESAADLGGSQMDVKVIGFDRHLCSRCRDHFCNLFITDQTPCNECL